VAACCRWRQTTLWLTLCASWQAGEQYLRQQHPSSAAGAAPAAVRMHTVWTVSLTSMHQVAKPPRLCVYIVHPATMGPSFWPWGPLFDELNSLWGCR
jgi:hypothetical protein